MEEAPPLLTLCDPKGLYTTTPSTLIHLLTHVLTNDHYVSTPTSIVLTLYDETKNGWQGVFNAKMQQQRSSVSNLKSSPSRKCSSYSEEQVYKLTCVNLQLKQDCTVLRLLTQEKPAWHLIVVHFTVDTSNVEYEPFTLGEVLSTHVNNHDMDKHHSMMERVITEARMWWNKCILYIN